VAKDVFVFIDKVLHKRRKIVYKKKYVFNFSNYIWKVFIEIKEKIVLKRIFFIKFAMSHE